jgi:hypothetical protein
MVLVVGLKYGDQGRACKDHVACGLQVKVGARLRMRPTSAGVVAVITTRSPACIVGFMSLEDAHLGDQATTQVLLVKELLSESTDRSVRRVSHRNGGAASVIAVDF